MPAFRPTRVLVAVTALHGATHLYTIFLQPLNPQLKVFFGLELDRDVTFFQTVYLLVYAVSNLLAGFLATRLPPRLLLSIGPALNGLAVAGMALLTPQDYAGMCVLTALGAAGGGLYHPVANLMLTEAFPERRGQVLGLTGIGSSLAFIAGPWGASALVQSAGWSWQQVTLCFGLLGVCCGGLAFFSLPAGRLSSQGFGARRSDLPPAGKPGTPAEAVPSHRAVLLFCCFAVLVMGGREVATWGTSSITPLFLEGTFGDSGGAGLLMAVLFVPGLVVQPLVGRWSDRGGREGVLSVAMFGMTATLFVLPYVSQPFLWVPFLILGAMLLATIPTFEALVADRAPAPVRGQLFGFVITAGIGLGALGPYLVGQVADAGERTPEAYRRAFHVLAALSGGCALLTFGLRPVARMLGLLARAPEKRAPAF